MEGYVKRTWRYLALVAAVSFVAGRVVAQDPRPPAAPGSGTTVIARPAAVPATISVKQCDGGLGKFDVFIGEAHDAQNKLTGKYEIVLKCVQPSTNPREQVSVAVFDKTGAMSMRRQGLGLVKGGEVVRLGTFTPQEMRDLRELTIGIYAPGRALTPNEAARGMSCGLPSVPPLRSSLPGGGGTGPTPPGHAPVPPARPSLGK